MGLSWGLPATSDHPVRFDGLEPDTPYAYVEGRWSEWFQTRAAPRPSPVQFMYISACPNGRASH